MRRAKGRNDEDRSRTNRGTRIGRLKEKLKRTPDQDKLVAMPDYPVSKCDGVPDDYEGEMSMKRIRRRPLNMNHKYRAVLSRGILELHDKKKKSSIGLNSEYRIDLSKVTVLTDDRRICLKFQVESILLTPTDNSFEKWKEMIQKHRIYQQLNQRNGVLVAPESPAAVTTTKTSNATTGEVLTSTATPGEMGWDNTSTALRVLESAKELNTLTLEVLDRMTKNLQELANTADDIRGMHRDIKNALLHSSSSAVSAATTPFMTSSGVSVASRATPKRETDDEEEEDSEGETSAEEALTEDETQLLGRSEVTEKNPNILFSLEAASANLDTKKSIVKNSLSVLDAPKTTIKSEKPERQTLRPVEVALAPVTTPIRTTPPSTKITTPPLQSPAPAAPKTTAVKSVRSEDQSTKVTAVQKSSVAVDVASKPKEVVTSMPRVRRETLPAQQCVSEGLGFKVLYQMVVNKTGLPLTNYEPLGTLQLMCEDLIWSQLLDSAAKMKAPEDRMSQVVAFALSSYTNGSSRSRKPFNPLWGETFDYEENGWKFHAEQVCHHPPISAAHAEGSAWSWWSTFSVQTSINKLSKSCDLIFDCPIRLRLKTDSGPEDYSWNRVKCRIDNLTGPPEQRKLTLEGQLLIKCSNGYTARLFFKRVKTPQDVVGDIVSPNEKIAYRLYGQWDKSLTRQRTTGETELLLDGSTLPRYPAYYGFSKFTMGLNEMDTGLAPTDSRHRMDMRALEQGDMNKAQLYKEALEKGQRNRAKNDVNMFPIWFTSVEDPFAKKTVYQSNGKYWQAKERGFKELKSSNVDIFSTN